MKTGLVLSNRSYNDYEAAYNRLRETSNVYKDLETFDKNWQTVKAGLSKTFPNLDVYITSLDTARQKGITYDSMIKQNNVDLLSDESALTLLFAETLADNEEKKTRERVVVDDTGRPMQNSDGSYQTEQYEATDYEYITGLLKEEVAYKRQEQYLQKQQELKDNRSFWEKAGADILGVASKFTAGMSHTLAGFLKWNGGLTAGIQEFFKTGSWNKASEARMQLMNDFDKYITFDKEFQETVYEFERLFTDFRDYQGRENNWGKYVGGLSYTFGQMMPGLIIAQGAGIAGGAIAGAEGAGATAVSVGKGIATAGKIGSSLIFYEAIAADNAVEMYNQLAAQGISVSTGMILAEADIKAAAQFGIEVGLAKILGGSNLDRLVFGRSTNAGLAKAGTEALTKNALVKRALLSVAHDFVEEGLEEVFQDMSDFLIDKGFDLVFKTSFGQAGLTEINAQSLFDSFIMGGLASLIGNAASIVTTKREVNPSKLKHDKNGNLVIDKEATAKYDKLIELQKSEMARLGITDEASLVVNKDSKFTKKDAAFIEEINKRKLLSGTDVIYEYEKMGKLASWAYGINLQSIGENFNKIQEMTNKAILEDNQVDLKKCKAALYQVYASTRLIASYFGEVGMERMQKANDMLTYISRAYYNKEVDHLDIKNKISQIIGTIDREQIKAATLDKELTIRERAARLAVKEETASSGITPEVMERVSEILGDCSIINRVSVEQFLEEPYIEDDVAHIDINSLTNCDAVVPEATFAEQDIISYISNAIETHKIGLSENEQTQLMTIYKKVNNGRIDESTMKDVIRALCFDSKFVAELLFHNDVSSFVFETIQRIQSAVREMTVSDAYSAIVKNKYKLVHDNIKAIIKAFIISQDYIRDFNKYNIFTKEEFEEIQNERYDKDFARKISENRMSPDDWKRLHNLIQTRASSSVADFIVAEYKNKMNMLAKGYASFSAPQLAMQLDNYLKKLLGNVHESQEFPSLTTAANRAFEYFLRSSGLNNTTLFDPNYLSNSDIAFANEQGLDIANPQIIHAAVFEVSCNNQYKIIFEQNSKKYIVTDNETYLEDISKIDRSVILQQANIRNYYNLYKEGANDIYAIMSFDEDQRKDFMRIFMGEDVSDFDLATTRLQDLVNDPSLLSENIKQKILAYNGKLTSNAVIMYMNSIVRQFSVDSNGISTAALGYSNTGDIVIYNTYSTEDYFRLSRDELFNLLSKYNENNLGSFLLKDILKNDIAIKALNNIEVEITDDENVRGSYMAFENKIYISYNTDTNTMLETLYHEFQHAIQHEYKMLSGFNLHDVIKVYYVGNELHAEVNNNIDLAAFEKAINTFLSANPQYKSSYEKDKTMFLYNIANMLYINSGELFAEGRGFNAQIPSVFLTPVPIYANNAGEVCVKLFGIEINTHLITGENLSSPLYSNISDIIGLENENLDSSNITLGQRINLSNIDADNITEEDTDASIEALFEALGGKKQFKSMADFYNHEFNVLYFEKKGANGKKRVVGTIINTDKVAIEKLIHRNEGTLFVGKVTPADILFFAPNDVNNVIVDREVAFDTEHIGVAAMINGKLTFNYMGQVVTTNTQNINAAPVDRTEQMDADQEMESKRILADTASTVKRLERKYGRKVIRAEYIKGGEGDAYVRKTRYYFDGSVTANRDYEDTAYVRPEGFYRGKKVTAKQAHSNQYSNLFKDKKRSREFQDFVREAYAVRDSLPEVLRTKIEDGTLTMRDIDEYIRSTDIDNIDEKTFELLNKTIYKNENIKTVQDLKKLMDSSSLFYAIGVVFHLIGKQELLDRRNSDGVLEEVKRILSEADPNIAKRIEGRIAKYMSYANISDKYLKLLYLKKYDGSIVSAFRAANFAKMAIDNDWNVTGEVRTISTSTEAQGAKGESFTPLEEIEDEVNSDTLEWLLSEEARYKKRFILQMAKRQLLLKVAMGKVKLENRAAFDRMVAELEDKADEWTEAQINKFYDMFSAKENDINKLYAKVMAAEVSGNNDYVQEDKKPAEQVEEAVDNLKHRPEDVVRRIKAYLKTIQRNVSEAERKKFLKMNSDILNEDFTIKDEILYDTIEGALQLKEYEILRKLEERMKQLSRYAQAHEISEKKQQRLRVQTDEEIKQITERIIREREREINAQAQIYIQNETNRLKQEYDQKIAELKRQIEEEQKQKTRAEVAAIKEKARQKLAEMKAKFQEQVTRIKNEAREKVKEARLKRTVQHVTNVVTYTVADTKIDVRTSIPMPTSLEGLLKIQFDQAVSNQIKFEFDGLTDEEQKSMHVRAEVSRFYEDNAEYMRSLTQGDIVSLAEFFVNSDLLYTNKESTYKAVAICTMKYILASTGTSTSLFTLDPDLRKRLLEKYNHLKSSYAQGMAIFREAEKINPTETMLAKLAKKLNVDITQEDITMLTKAVESGNYTDMAAAQSVIYEHMLEQHKNQQVSIFDKLLKFSRTAMLSSPGTWVRNWTSNMLVSSLNKMSEQVGGWITKHLFDKLFGHEKLKQKYKTAEAAAQALIAKSATGNVEGLTDEQKAELEQYQKEMKKYRAYADETQYRDLHLIKVGSDVKTFIDKEILSSGLLELIKDGLNKYDWAVNPHTTVENNLVRLITNSIRNKIFMNNVTDSKVLQVWYGFIYKRLSDDPYIEKAFLRYLGKTMTYDKVDLSQGLSAEVMNHIADAYTLAAADYMHKPNFVNDIEAYIRQKAGSAGFFVYKSIFPFLGAGVNWMVEGLKYTPAGLIWNIIRYAKLERTIDKMYESNQEGKGVSYRFGQYLLSRDIGKGVIGTIGFAIGALLAAFGVARIDDEDDEVKLKIGDLRIDISDIFGSNGITTGMALVSAIKDKKAPTFESTMKFVLNQMFIDSTLSNTYNTIRQSQGFGDYMMAIPLNMISNFIPNIISAVVSPTNVYKTKYDSGIVGKLERIAVKALPSLAYALPKYIDPYTGEYQIQYKVPWTKNRNRVIAGAGTVIEKAISRLTPLNVYAYNVSDNEEEALKLGVHKVALNNVKINDETIKLTNAQNKALNMYYGKLNNKTLTAFINNKVKYKVLDKNTNKYKELYYRQMTNEQKADVIERIMSNNATTAKIYILTSTGKYKYYASSYEKYQELKKLGISKNLYTKTDKREGFVEIK